MMGYGRVEEHLQSAQIDQNPLLATGSTGPVVSAQLTHPPYSDVAVKIISKGHSDLDLCPHATSTHPNVVHVICRLQDVQGRLCEVRELMSGGELFDEVAEMGAMAVRDAASFIFQAACGAAHMHAQGFASGQLRLEHFLRDASGSNVKLLPFRNLIGGTRGDTPSVRLRELRPLDPPEWRELALERSHGGTYGRFAPRESLPAADVWGLGIALATMMDGEPPFASTDPAECSKFAAAQSESRRRRSRSAAERSLADLAPTGPTLACAGLVGMLRSLVSLMLEPDPSVRPSALSIARHLAGSVQHLVDPVGCSVPLAYGALSLDRTRMLDSPEASLLGEATSAFLSDGGYDTPADNQSLASFCDGECSPTVRLDGDLNASAATVTSETNSQAAAEQPLYHSRSASRSSTGALASGIGKRTATTGRCKLFNTLLKAAIEGTVDDLNCPLSRSSSSTSVEADAGLPREDAGSASTSQRLTDVSEQSVGKKTFVEHTVRKAMVHGSIRRSSPLSTTSLQVRTPNPAFSVDSETNNPAADSNLPLTPSRWLFGR